MGWLEDRRSEFDIVYVSGDTDSFAVPRTDEALDLLERLVRLECDVLFTTRHVFDAAGRRRLAALAARLAERGRRLIGCVSVCQLTYPALEPAPIASPAARLDQLAWMRGAGLRTVLTIRPLLPFVAAEEYVEIARAGASGCDVILAGDWYADAGGVIEQRVDAAAGTDVSTLHAPRQRRPLDFTQHGDLWLVYQSPAAERALRRYCEDADIPFFMRSAPAVDCLRDL